MNGDKINYRPVSVIDDDGAMARIKSGLKSGELVALNLGENVPDGARVQPVMPNEK